MKKGIQISAAAILALSAITPVAAAAAENTVKPNGIYTSEGFTSLENFKKLSTSKKAALLTSGDTVALVIDAAVVTADLILTGTDAEIAEGTLSIEEYEEKYNVVLDPDKGIVVTPPVDVGTTVTGVKVSTVEGVTTVEAEVKNTTADTATVVIFDAEEAEVTSKDTAIVEGIVSETFEGLGAGTYTAQVSVGEVSATKDFTVEEEVEEGLVVESVSAITATGVTVTFPALTADIEGVTVEVKNSKDVVVAVETLDLSAGEETAEFTFTTPVKEADLTGIWTVDGVEFNLGLALQLITFEETDSQIELFELLEELGLENVDSANAKAYLDEKQDFLDQLAADEKELTVEAIQAFVNEVNASVITDADKEAAAKAVVKALGNNVALKSALQNAAFTKVNSTWIEDIATPAVDGYATELTGAGLVVDTVTVTDVQAAIDTVNEAVIGAQITAVGPNTSVDKTKLAELKTLIETYAPVNEEGEYVTLANQTALDNIAEQSAVADVLAATTASKFKTTVATLAGIANTPGTSDVIDLEDYVDANGKAYIDTIKDLNSAAPTLTPADYGVTDKVNLASEIASVIAKVNDVQADKGAVTEYAALKTAATNVKTSATATNKSKYIAALQAVGIKQVSSNSANVAEYIKTDGSTLALDLILAEATGVAGTSDVAAAKVAIQAVIDGANLAVVQSADATGIIAALNVLELKNVVAANAAAYVADTGANGVMNTTDTDNATKLQTALNKVNSAEAVKAAVKAINNATTATEVKTALDDLANEGKVAGYLNVTSADRIFIAEQVLDARADETDEKYTSETEVGVAVTAATEARTGTLIAVNALKITDDLTKIADALLLVGHESLTGTAGSVTVAGVVTPGTPTANDTNIADKFITSVTFDETDKTIAPDYRSIAEIRAALSGL